MISWLFCICRNEALLMPYLLRHYSTFVDRLIFYDDASDDGTQQLIAACPKAELRPWPGTHGLADDEFLDFANAHWQEARGKADWVFWIDADEFIYHPDIASVLRRYLDAGVEIPVIHGYGMVSNKLPATAGQIYDEIKTGFRSPEWDKPCVFQAKMNMVWTVGRHTFKADEFARPPVRSPAADLKLLHYRYLGLDYVAQRNQRNFLSQPDRCRVLNFGCNTWPHSTVDYSTHWFKNIQNQPFPNVI